MAFKTTWTALQNKITVGAAIDNWTANRGVGTDKLTVAGIGTDYLEVASRTAQNIQHIPREHFERVYEVWLGYVTGRTPRHAVRDKTRFSTYIISIFHWLEHQIGSPLP